jgi:DNA-binding GntR family transcriptional regulator
MASFEAHCEQCVKEMGEAFQEVHLWLDTFFGQEPYGTRHRHLRHHLEGIAEVRRKWGDKAAMAAEIHIRQDLESEGWPSDKPIPADDRAYKKAGLW